MQDLFFYTDQIAVGAQPDASLPAGDTRLDESISKRELEILFNSRGKLSHEAVIFNCIIHQTTDGGIFLLANSYTSHN